MIEKPKGKFVDRQDNDLPDSFEKLIEKYGLENVWEYIEKYWNDVESLTTNVSQALTDIDTLETDVQELQPIDSLDSASTTRPLSANQGRILNEKNYILVKLTENQSNSTANVETIVNFNSTELLKGSLFTLQSDGGIRVNENCDIEINAVLRFGYSAQSTKEAYLYKNSTKLINTSMQMATANTQTISSYFENVNANDIIYLKGKTSGTEASAFIMAATYLSIKKIG